MENKELKNLELNDDQLEQASGGEGPGSAESPESVEIGNSTFFQVPLMEDYPSVEPITDTTPSLT